MTTPARKYATMSRDYMARGEEYLRQGDLVQASEKSWGAAACALKAIAEQRGWHHQSHSLLFDISGQVSEELGNPSMRDLFAVARSMHQNFYQDWYQEDEVEHGVRRAREYLGELEAVTVEMPPSFTVETRAQRRRLERLNGQRPPHDSPSEEGT